MRLRRGLRVLRTGGHSVRIGTDPRWAVSVDGLTATQADRLAGAGDRPLTGRVPDHILAQLATAGLLRPEGVREQALSPLSAPDARVYALAGAGSADRVRTDRSTAVIGVTGLGRTGTVIASTLAVAGIGTVLLDDDTPVRPEDTGTGLIGADVGVPRAVAVSRLLHRAAPGVRTRWGATEPGSRAVRATDRRAPVAERAVPEEERTVRETERVTAGGDAGGLAVVDVVVSVSAEAGDPVLALHLLSAGVAHLPVVLREADAVIGPLVRAGQPPCLRCVELSRADLDPQWPRVLAQLRALPPGAGTPAALAVVTGGLAAAEVLRLVDGERPVTTGRQYEIPVPSMEPRLREWAAHPDCGCAALPRVGDVA